jgi:hypothetical protein
LYRRTKRLGRRSQSASRQKETKGSDRDSHARSIVDGRLHL